VGRARIGRETRKLETSSQIPDPGPALGYLTHVPNLNPSSLPITLAFPSLTSLLQSTSTDINSFASHCLLLPCSERS
jgi:hypothetical protein